MGIRRIEILTVTKTDLERAERLALLTVEADTRVDVEVGAGVGVGSMFCESISKEHSQVSIV